MTKCYAKFKIVFCFQQWRRRSDHHFRQMHAADWKLQPWMVGLFHGPGEQTKLLSARPMQSSMPRHLRWRGPRKGLVSGVLTVPGNRVSYGEKMKGLRVRSRKLLGLSQFQSPPPRPNSLYLDRPLCQLLPKIKIKQLQDFTCCFHFLKKWSRHRLFVLAAPRILHRVFFSNWILQLVVNPVVQWQDLRPWSLVGPLLPPMAATSIQLERRAVRADFRRATCWLKPKLA